MIGSVPAQKVNFQTISHDTAAPRKVQRWRATGNREGKDRDEINRQLSVMDDDGGHVVVS